MLIAHMVVRNEAHRYLRSALEALRPQVDVVTVFDDRSEDNTVEIARQYAHACACREPDEPSFAENESAFRSLAWHWMEAAVKPQTGDWILAIDADEFLVCTEEASNVGEAVQRATGIAWEKECDTVVLPITEIFGWQADTVPPVALERIDGYWNCITGVRLSAWEGSKERKGRKVTAHRFVDQIIGGGSVPNIDRMGRSLASFGLRILHFGYASPDDRAEKYSRYSRYKDLPGHNPAHVASIMQPGQLRPWLGPTPEVRRGQ